MAFKNSVLLSLAFYFCNLATAATTTSSTSAAVATVGLTGLTGTTGLTTLGATTASATTSGTSMWVWNSVDILSDATHASGLALVQGAYEVGITNLYFYMSPGMYSVYTSAIEYFIEEASAYSIKVWALDGDRSYIATPSLLYGGLANLVAYNKAAPTSAKFYGFSADIEPQDSGLYTNFTNGYASSDLTTSQAANRTLVLQSWLGLHAQAQTTLHANNLKFASAMPWWLGDYNGEALAAPWPVTSTSSVPVMNSIMPLVDYYVVMSYDTYTANALSRVLAQVVYATTNLLSTKVMAGMDVVAGNGEYVSYADTPGLASKSIVMEDLEIIVNTLGSYTSFAGVAIEDWESWNVMAT